MDVDEILLHAIEKEAEAGRLYGQTAGRADDKELSSLLRGLEGDEEEHKRDLEALRERGPTASRPEAALDLNLAPYLARTPLSPGATLREARQYAVHREHDARHIYLAMANACEEGEAGGLSQRLAAMENSHKARLEEQFYPLFLSGP